jgi:predicted nucleic acid-binding protein
MTLVFVDSGVLIHAEDGACRDRQSQALAWIERLWRARSGRVSTQVLNEFYVSVTRRLTPPMPQGDARAKLRRFAAGWNPWQIDQATVETAWAMEARHGLPYWDCLVLAAAQHSGCTLVLSEGMAHEGRYGAVRVVNPFLVSIDEVLGSDER